MTTAGEYKYELGCIRSGVIAQIRKLLNDRGHNDIDFTETLVFASPEGQEGEQETVGGYVLSNVPEVPDTVVMHFYGDVSNEHGTDDLTTDQLVWVLEQVEKEAYELVDNSIQD